MRKGFLVVSGCPRSGTSVTMDILREAHGIDALCGEKFPQETRKSQRNEMLAKGDGEAAPIWRCRKYLLEKQIMAEEASSPKKERDFHDMNPDGFWEMAFTVKGIIYRHQFGPLLRSVRNGELRAVKVVSQGLLASDPSYIGKILYSIRHPRAVAKSQERLVRGFSYEDEDGKKCNAFDDIVIHTPEMYIDVTNQAAQFLLMYPEIPVRFHHFEDLVTKPKEVIDKMAEFVGRGDYSKSYDVVKPNLNRSQHEDVESDLWEDADFVYDNFCKAAEIINQYAGDHHGKVKSVRKQAEPYLKAIIAYLTNPRRNSNRQKRQWACYRAKQHVGEAVCVECYKGKETARNFLAQSEQTESQYGVTKPWREEPCLWECGMNLDREESLTFEESIENNWWEKLDMAKAEVVEP